VLLVPSELDDEESLVDESLSEGESLDDEESLSEEESSDEDDSLVSPSESDVEPAAPPSELVSEDELSPPSLPPLLLPPTSPPPLLSPLPLLPPPLSPLDFEQPASDTSPAASPAPVILRTVRLSGRFEESDMVPVGRDAHSPGDARPKRVF